MMAVGIPEYRLPKRVLRTEVERIAALGLEICLNTALGWRQRLKSVVDNSSAMSDEERKRMLQMIYVEAVLARQRREQDTLVPVTTSERKTGGSSTRK